MTALAALAAFLEPLHVCPCGAVFRTRYGQTGAGHRRSAVHREWEAAYVAGEVDRAQ